MPKNQFSTASTESRTIPGQSLVPSELLKRHLAGTLPPIDQSKKYEYHYDEEGNQIGEPLPVDYQELHNLAVAIRKRQFEEATKARKAKAEKERAKIIADYEKAKNVKVVDDPKTIPPPSSDSNKSMA